MAAIYWYFVKVKMNIQIQKTAKANIGDTPSPPIFQKFRIKLFYEIGRFHIFSLILFQICALLSLFGLVFHAMKYCSSKMFEFLNLKSSLY